ncbi:MAG: hypothetical protein HY831_02275 [Candidatus Aenigmarchaeota archaeon]|nr:hypothetical protein [Candidatus Aenigmarchaeota archaeon]
MIIINVYRNSSTGMHERAVVLDDGSYRIKRDELTRSLNDYLASNEHNEENAAKESLTDIARRYTNGHEIRIAFRDLPKGMSFNLFNKQTS